jgi:hypothetical protein
MAVVWPTTGNRTRLSHQDPLLRRPSDNYLTVVAYLISYCSRPLSNGDVLMKGVVFNLLEEALELVLQIASEILRFDRAAIFMGNGARQVPTAAVAISDAQSHRDFGKWKNELDEVLKGVDADDLGTGV